MWPRKAPLVELAGPNGWTARPTSGLHLLYEVKPRSANHSHYKYVIEPRDDVSIIIRMLSPPSYRQFVSALRPMKLERALMVTAT